jgi:NADPH:quinone reductase-like Zn-dependent oxidoreductase
MKAIVQDGYGPPDELEFRDIPTPVPGAGQVLVRVRAASVNARDWHILRGDPKLIRYVPSESFGRQGPRHPVRGTDVAGVVEAVGDGVTRLKAGDEVFGDLGEADGAFAEYACASEELLELKPASLSFEEAAAVPLAGNTALIGLRDVAGLRAGQRVLVNGAAGGVGTFAVQLAKALGAAEVNGVCGTDHVELVRKAGADHVIDYTRDDLASAGTGYDILFDLVGTQPPSHLRRVVARDGTLVLSGGGLFDGGSVFGPMGMMLRGKLLSPLVPQRLRNFLAQPSRANLTTLADLADAGKLRPVIGRTYPLSQAVEALRYVETGHAGGKVVITVP